MIKKIFFAFTVLLLCFSLKAQLAGTYTVPGTYTSMAAVINDLNLLGVTGPVTINVSSGYTETVPVGGLTLTATGTAVNPIVFQKTGTGANPILSAFSGGNATPASAIQDGIWSLIGSDYITISNIDLVDPNFSNNATMEYGYGLFKANANDGCNNVTIRNCTVTLNRVNNASGSGPSSDGSRAINVVNSLITSQTTSLAITSPAGSHSSNKFYSNVLQNCNIGIAIVGLNDVSPYTNADNGNDIGGVAAATSNTIQNFGGGGTNTSIAIRTYGQQSLNIGFNRINNNNGSGVNHTGNLKGISVETAGNANVTVRSNVVTLKYGGSNSTVTCIENTSGSAGTTNTVDIISNQITQCTNSLMTGGTWYGIYNNGASAANLLVRSNSFTGNNTNATSGSSYLIANSGSVTGVMTFSSNSLSHSYTGSFANTGAFYGILNTGGTNAATLNIVNNTFSAITFPVAAGSGFMIFAGSWGSSAVTNIIGNIYSGLNLNNSGSQALISNSGFTQNSLDISNNSVTGNYTRSSTSGNLTMISSGGYMGSVATLTISNNSFTGIINNGLTTGSFLGIGATDGTALNGVYPRKYIFNNLISGITFSSSSSSIHYGCLMNGLGDGGTGLRSEIYNNEFSNFTTAGNVIGFWILGQSSGSAAPVVSNNTIAAITTNTGSSTGVNQWIRGMYVDVGAAGLQIQSSKIYSLTAHGNQSEVYGMLFSGITTVTLNNNVVGNLYTPAGYGGTALFGIKSAAGTGTIHLYHNTIHLNASSNQTSFRPCCLSLTSFERLIMKNNIFVNNSVPQGSGGQAAVRREWGASSEYDLSSNNNIFYAGTCGQCALMESGSASYYNINQLKTAVYPRESNSHQESTTFASISGSSNLFLHINLSVFSQSDNGGTAIPGYSTDIDNNIRQGYPGYLGLGSAPDIGADEYDGNISICSGALSPFVAPSTNTFCSGTPIVMLSNVSTMQSNRIYQWNVGTSATGPFTAAINGSGSTNTTYISPPLPPGTYYYVLTNTCTTNSNTNISNTASVQILPAPSYTLSASAGTLCAGQNITLNATGAGGVFFFWSGPNLINSANQNMTINSAGINYSGTYTFQATATTQCSGTQTIAVQITPSVTSVSITPTNSTICTGGSVNLGASGGMTGTSYDIGTQTNTVTNNMYLSPYTAYLSGQRKQMIVLATELSGAGIAPNTPLTGIQFPVNSMGQYWQLPALWNQGDQAFAVRIGTTTLSSFSLQTPFQNGLATVVNPANFRPQTGYGNYHIFTTPFVWDGVNNIIVETTFGNGSYLPYPDQGVVQQFSTLTPDTLTIGYLNNNMTAAQIAGSGSPNAWYMLRPNFKFDAAIPGSYTWSPAQGLSATSGQSVNAAPQISSSYTVTVTDNTCSASGSAQINVVIMPTVTVNASSGTICAGQLVTLSASGATSYQWLNGPASQNYVVIPAASTSYTVLGTNAPCPSTSANISVVVNPLPVVSAQANPQAICKGQTTTLTATGTGNFQWNTGSAAQSIAVSPQSSTSYVVTLTSVQQCQSSTGVQVTVYSLPPVGIVPVSSATVCEGQIFDFTATGAQSYTWMPMNVIAATLSWQTSQQFTVTGSDNNGCLNTITGELVVDPCAGIVKNFMLGEMVAVYPNPNSGSFIIRIPWITEEMQIILRDASGRKVLSQQISAENSNVQMRDLANGIYFIECIQGGKIMNRQRVIRQ
jgi:hypothetical protein